MKLLEATKKTGSKIEKAIFLVTVLCMANDIPMTKKHIEVLSYYIVYGVKQETEDLMMKSKIVKTPTTMRNIKSILLGLGFLKRVPDLYNSYELNMDGDFSLDDKINLFIKIDNS